MQILSECNNNKRIIDLSALTPKGMIESKIADGVLNITTTRAIHDIGYNIIRDRITSYMLLPDKYRLPMQIDLTVKIDSPELLILLGKGHVTVGSPWMENRRIEDISEPTGKPKLYDNNIPLNEFVDIRFIYNPKEMQILINGEERYFSTKERYMKSPNFLAENASGFAVGITCTKRAQLSIKYISVTEYADKAPLIHDANIIASREEASQPEPRQVMKPTFESCIEELPEEIKNEIINTASFIKTLKQLKFKRIIEKHGNKISYVASNIGISYAIYLSGSVMHHSLQWYIITNSKPEFWHRKSNMMEETLEFIGKSSPGLADRIFANLNECIGCREHCLARTLYKYQSQKKLTCQGSVFFKMSIPDFGDVRDFLCALNEMLEKNTDADACCD